MAATVVTTCPRLDELNYSSCCWVEDPPEDSVLQFKDSSESWKLGPIFKERLLKGDEHEGFKLSEALAICIATQINGPRKGTQAIAKIRVQIPPGMNNPWDYEPGLDYSVYKSPFISVWSHTEVTVLQYLTLKGCKCTPLYIGHEVRVQSDHDYLPGGYVVYTLMEKLPGINLVDWPDFPLEKRNRVRIAFGKAIREFYSYGFVHNDPQRHNIMWDENTDRCWIIDLEDVDYEDPPRKFVPRRDWADWGIIGVVPDGELDPMAPDYYDECPDDDALYALATRTKTRQLCEDY